MYSSRFAVIAAVILLGASSSAQDKQEVQSPPKPGMSVPS